MVKRKQKRRHNSKQKEDEFRNIHYHIKHKSRLTFLLAAKVLLIFIVSFLVFKIFYSYFLESFGLIPAWIISFVIAVSLYLIIVIKVLHLMKF